MARTKKGSPSAAALGQEVEATPVPTPAPEVAPETAPAKGSRKKKAAKPEAATEAIAPETASEAVVPEVVAPEAIVPEPDEYLKLGALDIVSMGSITLEYETRKDGTCRPIMKVEGKIYFSGWLCKDRDAAESLLIPLYYQYTGTIQSELISLNPNLLATHPLSELIYPEDNMGVVGESFDEHGNRTEIFRVVINPNGLALSGNTRLKILKDLQRKTQKSQIVHCVTTKGQDDISIILGGNVQRVKTSQEMLNEAMVKASALGEKKYWTNVRRIYKDLGGSGGAYDATKVLVDFVQKRRTDDSFSKALSNIGRYSPTVALELIKLHRAGHDSEGQPLPLNQRLTKMGTELNLLARQKNADPVRVELVYDGIAEDTAAIKQHYNGETTVEIARQLMLASPQVRLRMVEEAAKGVKIKMSVLREQLERELLQAQPAEEDDRPDWNALNAQDQQEEEGEEGEEEEEESTSGATGSGSSAGSTASSGSGSTSGRSSAPASTPAPEADTSKKGYYLKLGQMGIFPDSCWIVNETTAAALNESIGGVADVDPYAEPDEGYIKCDRKLIATERPTDKSYDWGGGIHDSGKGLRVATALPPRHGMIECAAALFERIEDGTIAEACFIADASLLSINKFAAHLKSTPYAWVNVSRENKHSEAGFGFEPSEYVLSRFKTQTADNWNDRCCDYVIVYYGKDYDRFERACSKFGVVSYNSKAATFKSVLLDWKQSEENENEWLASYDGMEFTIKYVGSTYFLYIDNQKTDDRFKKLEKAQKAAVVEALLVD
jgi:hypothetical protein